MDFREYPLLNTPSLSAVVLRTAAAGPASVADCMRRLEAALAQAGETLPDAGEIAQVLETIAEDLIRARLLHREGERLVITPRGREELARRPEGVTRADLMDYPEFAAAVHEEARDASRDDPRPAGYRAGAAAFRAGRRISDNPFRTDTADHLAWENGWSEASDLVDRGPPA